MLLLAALACSTEYDVDTWNSPLALQAEEPGDPARGEDLYYNEHWEDSSIYGFTCQSCHNASASDTWTSDDSEFTLAAHTTWNAPYRETWKVSQTWDLEESGVLGAYGGQICVKAYFPSGSEMTPQQAADLEAWMRDNRDETDEAETAQPLDFGFTSWDTKDDFLASLDDGAGGWLRGADIGDVDAGYDLTQEYCGACHINDGATEVTLLSVENLSTLQLTQRIRKFEHEGVKAPNSRMPRVPEDKLSDDDLADILAYLTQESSE